MQCYRISINDPQYLFEKLGCDKTGCKILSKKSDIHTLYIKDIHFGAANILKQDALSIGADLAVPSGVIIGKEKYVDAILLGNTKHFETLSRKESAQPFGLKTLAKELKNFIKQRNYATKIMGVINANEDSFYKKSRFNETNAVLTIESMIHDGADIIDIGGVSSRPGSVSVTEDEELKRIKPICDLIHQQNFHNKVDFSIDSYQPKVIDYALNKGFNIVNDITGLTDDNVAKVTSNYDAQLVIMHMQKNPIDMQNEPKYENVMLEISDFFDRQIKKAHDFGIKKIVLDVGIGFGKTLDHNLALLNNLEHFKKFGHELLIGASRKSMINNIVTSSIEERLPGTLAIHLESLKKGASIVRCHDVKEHYQAIKVQEAILNQKMY